VTPDGPEPPPDLPSRRLTLRSLGAGTELWRVHDLQRGAIWFGPGEGRPPAHRFDAPGGEFRVCYVGLSPEASFAETFLRNPGRRLLDVSLLATRSLTSLTVTRRLRVARLHGPEMARLGATAEVAHGSRYDLSRRWSLALWSHPQRPDGILYTSRHDDVEPCLALFGDRCADALEEGERQPLLRAKILPALLRRYRLGFDPSG
jgi:hypothetical protein